MTLAVESLGKRFLLPVSASADSQAAGRRSLLGLTRAVKRAQEFWALRNVSFEVEPGTILGIIGANGADKSTLLKVLARVTPPTEGAHAVWDVSSRCSSLAPASTPI